MSDVAGMDSPVRRRTRIVGTGSCMPANRVANEDLVERLGKQGIEMSSDWIVERTGIRARHFVADDQASSDLGAEAARRALQAAGRRPRDVDLIIVATSTPDQIFPSTACLIQQKLGMHGFPAFDVQAVCSGFVYALTVADALVQAGGANCALVIGADTFSRLLDFGDRSTCVLFGDGAGAVLVECASRPGGILASDLHADGRHASLLCVPGQVRGGELVGHASILMDGQAVFKLAVTLLEESARSVLDKAGIAAADIDWLIPHQANIRIMRTLAKKLGLPEDKLVVTVAEHGNTSAASIPLALDQAVRAGRIQAGDKLLLQGVGAGFAWGSLLIQY